MIRPRRALVVYGSVIATLLGILIWTSVREGTVPWVGGMAVATSAAIQVGMTRSAFRRGWRVPYSAVITGLILGVVLPGSTPATVVVASSALALGSKYLLRIQDSAVLNPAAVGLLLPLSLMHLSAASWKPATVSLPIGLLLVPPLAVALFLSRRIAVAVTFGAAFAIPSYLLPGLVPDFSSSWMLTLLGSGYFAVALLMITDPRTSPWPGPMQAAYGASVGVGMWALAALSVPDPFLYALLLGNVAYALARHRERLARWVRTRTAPESWRSPELEAGTVESAPG